MKKIPNNELIMKSFVATAQPAMNTNLGGNIEFLQNIGHRVRPRSDQIRHCSDVLQDCAAVWKDKQLREYRCLVC